MPRKKSDDPSLPASKQVALESSGKIQKLFEKKARQIKAKKSFKKVKEATSRDLGEMQTIDLEKQSQKNMEAVRTRLKKLSKEEKVLFDRLLQQPFILHHTTSHALIEKIQSTTGALRDPFELARYETEAQNVHTPDFCGINENIFFGMGTSLSEIPFFTRHGVDPSTQKPVDYCTVRIELQKLQAMHPEIFDTLWSSGHFYHYLEMTHAKNYELPDIRVGNTNVTWKYQVNDALEKEEERVKLLSFKQADGQIHTVKIGMKDEIAVGRDIIPYYAMCFIERFRLLDQQTKDWIYNNPNDQDALSKLMDVFFRVDEFEVHLPANLPLSDEYTTYVTPEARRQMTESVSTAAKNGDVSEIKRLHNTGIPIKGYMYEDPFHYDEAIKVDNPLIAAIKEKEYKTVNWLLEEGVHQDAFHHHAQFQLRVGADDLFTQGHIIQVLNTAIETLDIEMIKLLVDEWQLKINDYFSSKLSAFLQSNSENSFNKMMKNSGLNNDRSYEYDSAGSDLTFASLLASGLSPPHPIYQFLREKLNYCKKDDFLIREMYDTAQFGHSNQMAYHQKHNPHFEEHKWEILEICKKRSEMQMAVFEIIKTDNDSVVSELKNLEYGATRIPFNREFADALLSQLEMKDNPEALRKFLGEKWIAGFIFSPQGFAVDKKVIVDRLSWLVERLNVSPNEIIKESFGSKKINVVLALCEHRCFAEAKAYIEKGYPAHYEDVKYNPLHYALMKGDLDFANYLLNEKKVPATFPSDFIHDTKYSSFTPETLSLTLKLGAVAERDAFYTMLKFRKFALAEIYNQQGLLPWEASADNNKIEQCNFVISLLSNLNSIDDKSTDAIEWLLERKVLNTDLIHHLYDYCNNTSFLTIIGEDDSRYNSDEAFIGKIEDTELLLLMQLFTKHITPVQFSESLIIDLFKKNPLGTLTFCKQNTIPLNEMIKSHFNDEERGECLKNLIETSLENFTETGFMMLFKWCNESGAFDVDSILKNNQDFLFECILKMVQKDADFNQILNKFVKLADNLAELENNKGISLVREAMASQDPYYGFGRPPRLQDVKVLVLGGADPHFDYNHFDNDPELGPIYQSLRKPEPMDANDAKSESQSEIRSRSNSFDSISSINRSSQIGMFSNASAKEEKQPLSADLNQCFALLEDNQGRKGYITLLQEYVKKHKGSFIDRGAADVAETLLTKIQKQINILHSGATNQQKQNAFVEIALAFNDAIVAKVGKRSNVADAKQLDNEINKRLQTRDNKSLKAILADYRKNLSPLLEKHISKDAQQVHLFETFLAQYVDVGGRLRR